MTMTENEVLEMLLDIKEIQIDRFEVQGQSLHIRCSSVLEEALCPQCLQKRQVINQTYVQEFRDLPIAGKEVYLHLIIEGINNFIKTVKRMGYGFRNFVNFKQ